MASIAKSTKPWRVIPRPVLETVLNNHAQHHRVHQPLVLHGPRGVGKTTLILERLIENWNKGPHITGYVDFAQPMEGYHPTHNASFPWYSWSTCSSPHPPLSLLKIHLEKCLESMAERGIELGQINSHQIFTTLNKWHGLNNTLRLILQSNSSSKTPLSDKVSTSVLWDRAVFAYSARLNPKEIEGVVGLEGDKKKAMTVEESSYLKEAVVALRLAKEVIRVQQGWRASAISDLNRTGGFSRSLTSLATDWPGMLLELLSAASEIDHFQPKLVMNNIEVLKNAIPDNYTISPSTYHDSLIWRIISLGANEMCLPVILVTSDSYYSYHAYIDFGFPDIFISRETFGWSSNEAKLHMVPSYFSASEWATISEVLGSNSRHLFELHALKESEHYLSQMDHTKSTFEDIVDAYLAYLQAGLLHLFKNAMGAFVKSDLLERRDFHWMGAMINVCQKIIYGMDPKDVRGAAPRKAFVDLMLLSFKKAEQADTTLDNDLKPTFNKVRVPQQTVDDNKQCGYYVCRIMIDIIRSRLSFLLETYITGSPKTFTNVELDVVRNLWTSYLIRLTK